MKKNYIEIITLITIVVILIGTPFAVSINSPWNNKNSKTGKPHTRIINLTAVAGQGIWTEDKVDGLNYWNTQFKRANIILTKGEKVIFRFTSVDVTHSFYVPEIGLGPVIVEAGHIYDVPFTTDITGKFTYYCTTVCGHCHLYMRGNIVILTNEEKNNPDIVKKLTLDTIRPECCNVNPKMPVKASSFVQHGKMLFKNKGCYLCHGEAGKGGVYNPNYAQKFVPTLNTLADKLKLSDKDEADSIIKYLESGSNLEKLNDNPPFETYNRFYAQYGSITKKILDGAPNVLRLDSLGCNPPLLMPSWNHHLSKRDINSIIAYLINIYDWENN